MIPSFDTIKDMDNDSFKIPLYKLLVFVNLINKKINP